MAHIDLENQPEATTVQEKSTRAVFDMCALRYELPPWWPCIDPGHNPPILMYMLVHLAIARRPLCQNRNYMHYSDSDISKDFDTAAGGDILTTCIQQLRTSRFHKPR